MKTLLEDYKRRLATITTMIENNKNYGSTEDIKRAERFSAKAECYRTFISELEREIKETPTIQSSNAPWLIKSNSELTWIETSDASERLVVAINNGNEANLVAKRVAGMLNCHNELVEALTEVIKTANPKDVNANKIMMGTKLGEYYVGSCGIPSDKAVHMAVNAIAKATK